MQPKNLALKFAFVGALILLCIYAIWAKELRQGIDLKGGHVLTFEIKTTETEKKAYTRDIDALQKELGATTQPAAKAEIQKKIADLTEKRDKVAQSSEGTDLVQRVIARLKQRIDPNGLSSLEWRPVGANRFEVRMPLGTEASRIAKQRYLDALQKLQDDNIQRSDVRRIISLAGADRSKVIEQVAKGDKARVELLTKMGVAYDAMNAARAKLDELKNSGKAAQSELSKAEDALADAVVAHDQAVQDVFDTNVNIEQLGQTLELYLSARESEKTVLKEREARAKGFNDQLAKLREQHASRAADINAVVLAYQDWSEKRTGLDDPADLKRLISRAGVLEFRIAPLLPGTQHPLAMDQGTYEAYENELLRDGPMFGRNKNEPFLWFPIREGSERFSQQMITGKYAGKKYLLLYNQAGFEILQDPRHPAWSLTSHRTSDQLNKPAVGFNLDARGARLMGTLTNNHKSDYMAILLDDDVYSAPVIRASIYDSGIIEGDFTQDTVDELVRTLNAGSLEARVDPNPVSEKTIAPSMGEDNRRAGLQSTLWSLLAVIAFMAIYYFFSGAIANFAMLLNLLLTLGAMSFVEAVFTLPGIAGLALACAMAVDANVLIFERLREEQQKIQSIRMAIRNAYHNAFSAIFDSNMTTLIAAVILLWVGTEEVKGFAITLGLGVIFNLWTAISVTRWIYQWMLEKGVIKNHVRMLRNKVWLPKVDWIAKRRVFWGLSLVTSVFGLVALFSQGKDILGLEFSSGTQAVFNFREGAVIDGPGGKKVLPVREYVEDDVRAAAGKLAEQATAQVKQDEQRLASVAADQKDKAAEQLKALREKADDLNRFKESAKVETVLSANKAKAVMEKFDANGDKVIDKQEWETRGGAPEAFALLDLNHTGKLDAATLDQALTERGYQVSSSVPSVNMMREVVRAAFGSSLDMQVSVKADLLTARLQPATQPDRPPVVVPVNVPAMNIQVTSPDGKTLITPELADKANPDSRPRFINAVGGVMFVLQNMDPPLEEKDMADRIQTMRMQPDFEGVQYNQTVVIGLQGAKQGGFSSMAVLVYNPNSDFSGRPKEWKDFADKEWRLVSEAMTRQQSQETISVFHPAVAAETSQLAIIALVLSWMAIIIYLWVRFGQSRWGIAAVVALIHDVIIAVGMISISGWLGRMPFFEKYLLVTPMQIDMTTIAAILTIIGYSVNDTIVIFDRIRENRGKLKTVDADLINRSINQTMSRTLLTSSTVILALAIMYAIGGPGIHGFCYAMLFGVLTGTYSSFAVASPLLLGFKAAAMGKAHLGAEVAPATVPGTQPAPGSQPAGK